MDNMQEMKIQYKERITEHFLIRLFYCCGLSSFNQLFNSDDVVNANNLVEVLLKYNTKSIIEIIRADFIPFEIDKSDVPQFSDIENAFKVPFLLKNCGIESVDYAQMGYMLRTDRRGVIADKKYGENHMKTACQMGLCAIEKCKAQANALGNAYVSLSKDKQDNLAPKLCLKIPFMTNYFLCGANEDYLQSQISILSPSTQKRRLTNIRTLISIIQHAIKNGL